VQSSCEYGNEMLGHSRVAAQLVVSLVVLSSMELVTIS
jgi:hypothetical protein